MAVPKKRTSKTKTKVHKTIWKKKADRQAKRFFSRKDAILSRNDKNERSVSAKSFENSNN